LANRTVRVDWDASDGAVQYSVERDPDGAFGPGAMAVLATEGAAVRSHAVTRQSLADVLHQTWRVRPCTTVSSCAVTTEQAVTGNLAGSIERVTGLGAAQRMAMSAMAYGRPAPDIEVLAVGVPEGSGTRGMVRLFARQGGGGWVLSQTLVKGLGAVGDRFGHSLAMSKDGRWLAVGVPGDDLAPDVPDVDAHDAGAVHLYGLSDATGLASLSSVVHAPNPGRDDAFGSAVALDASGSLLAVGAPFEDSSAAGTYGAADAAARYPDADAIAEGHDFGAVYAFTRTTTTSWDLSRYVKPAITLAGAASDIRSRGYFGSTIAVSDQYTAIGAPGSSRGATFGGAVQIFAHVFGWLFVHERFPPSDQAASQPTQRRFGAAVSYVSDNLLAIGDPDTTVDGILGAGRVHLLGRLPGNTWVDIAGITAPRPTQNARFGSTVVFTGAGNERLLIGAPGDRSSLAGLQRPSEVAADASTGRAHSGAVYHYQNLSGNWTLKARLKAPAPVVDAALGQSIAVSADGGLTAVGAEVRDDLGGEILIY
jgi:hypothetical protein